MVILVQKCNEISNTKVEKAAERIQSSLSQLPLVDLVKEVGENRLWHVPDSVDHLH